MLKLIFVDFTIFEGVFEIFNCPNMIQYVLFILKFNIMLSLCHNKIVKEFFMLNKIMVQMPVMRKSRYPILFGNNILFSWNKWLPECAWGNQLVIITDEIVKHVVAQQFATELIQSGYTVLLLSIIPGEESKSNKIKEYLELQMVKAHCDRHTVILAIGGGVVGDLAGFIAATYMRGIKYIQVPTTALAMIDSSVGGKTAINTMYGKNLIGAFYQPQAVIMDFNLLNSLPKTQLINGIIEALKIFLTSDAKSFAYANSHLDAILKHDSIKLQQVIKRAVKLKVAIVKTDELEENLRMVLNFGHTVGHALEKISNFQILHGYAVALGILVEAKIAQLRGLLSQLNYDLIAGVFYRLGINREMLYTFNLEAVAEAALSDKKTKNNQIYCILLEDIGKVYCGENVAVATLIDKDDLYQAFAALK